MLNLKLRIMYRAIKIRLENGENLQDIFVSYPRLTEEEKEILLSELNIKEKREVM